VAPAEFGVTSTCAVILLVTGLMRDKTPLASVTIHTASGLAAIPPSLCEGVVRDPPAKPSYRRNWEPRYFQNLRPGRNMAADSYRRFHFIGLGIEPVDCVLGTIGTQMPSSVITCQSGVPSTGKTASGVMPVISRFTPGVETPGLGCRGPFFRVGATVGGGGSCA